MKPLQSRREIILPYLIVALLSVFFIVGYAKVILLFYQLYWLALPALAFLFWKLPRARLEDAHFTAPPPSLLIWLCEIALLQLGLMSGNAVIPALFNTYHRAMLTETLHPFLNNWLPWFPIAIASCLFAKLHYFEKKRAFFSTIIEPLWRSPSESVVGLIANRAMELLSQFALSASLIFLVLIFLHYLPIIFPALSSLQTTTIESAWIAVCWALTLFIFKKRFTRFSYQHARKPFFLLGCLFLFSIIFLSLFHFLFQYHASEAIQLPTWFLAFPLSSAASLLSIWWWSAWVIWIAIQMALRSRGRTLREMIIGLVVVPGFISYMRPLSYIHHGALAFYAICIVVLLLLSLRNRIYQNTAHACIDPPLPAQKMHDQACAHFWKKIYFHLFLVAFFLLYGMKILMLVAGFEVLLPSLFLVSLALIVFRM